MSTNWLHTLKQNCNFIWIYMTFQWMLFIKGKVHNAECPVKCQTQSVRSTAFFKYLCIISHWPSCSIMYCAHQMVILTSGLYLGFECNICFFLQIPYFGYQMTFWAWRTQPTLVSRLPLHLGPRRSQIACRALKLAKKP